MSSRRPASIQKLNTSLESGEKNRTHIDSVLESAKLLEALYASADIRKEVTL